MRNVGRRSLVSSPHRLATLFAAEFGAAVPITELFTEFLQQHGYNEGLSLKLIALAKQPGAVSWEIRRLAVAMLEHQALQLPVNKVKDWDRLLTALNLKPLSGIHEPVAARVLQEGYSSTAPDVFIPELLQRLARFNYIHEKLVGTRTPDSALRCFIDLSRTECKLTLARYLFTPAELVDRIFSQLQITNGIKDIDTAQPVFIADEIAHAISRLPEFEADILKRICSNTNIYWVTQDTSSKIHSLLEYPLTTVVLVIKPPGSEIEFEIKRAGRKGDHALNVVYDRNGYTVPPSHRLDGGSMQWLLRYEVNSATRFSRIYRLVHGTEAPVPAYVSSSTIHTVPATHGPVQTLPYFTEASMFGNGFRQMRAAMQETVAAFNDESGTKLPALPGALGLTAHFISQVAPAQAILCGTSSFRLDKLATYLSDEGPQQYFEAGLGCVYSTGDARRLADALLQEILGAYQPPKVNYRTYGQYVAAALRSAENRATADRVYQSLAQQIGHFWGTLLAIRGYSRGESFVARNVGLKSHWHAGRWRVKIIFMDHDSLEIPGQHNKNFLARDALPEMARDERYIWGGNNEAQFSTSELGYLQGIYSVNSDISQRGAAGARVALKDAYLKTQRALLHKPELQQLFNEQFISRLVDWDRFVAGYLSLNGDKAKAAAWKREMKDQLDAKGYRREAFSSYANAVETNRVFLEAYRELFECHSFAANN